MTRIDFYSNVPNKLAYTCRLVRKAYAVQCQIILFSQDQEELSHLDRLLWTFSEQDFLPHVYADDPLAIKTPIILTNKHTLEFPHHQVLINLADTPPLHLIRFKRILEIISTDENSKSAGRKRYLFYKKFGYPLNHFIANNLYYNK